MRRKPFRLARHEMNQGSYKVMIKDILCPVDLSESSRRAIRWAENLASKLEAELTFLHVLDTSRFDHGGVVVFNDFLNELRHRVEHELSDLAGSTSTQVHVEVADGDPYETILDRVERLNVDLLVMSPRTHSTTGRPLIGSLTEKILDHVTIPVLVVTDDATLILKTVPPNHHDSYQPRLPDRALVSQHGKQPRRLRLDSSHSGTSDGSTPIDRN